MHKDPETTGELKHLAYNQAMEHFDPYEGLVDTGEKEEELRNIRYGFRIGDYNILINKATLCEVVQHAQIYKLPNTAAWVLGMINLRGNLIPVFDLKERLGDGTGNDDSGELLIIEQGDHAAGIVIDGLPQAIEIDMEVSQNEVSPPQDMPEALKSHSQNAYHVNERTWIEIEHRGLFSELLADAGLGTEPANASEAGNP